MNLKCLNLSQFKWYKDVNFSKLFTRSHSNHEFWKEKFLSGQPHFFSDRDKNRIKQKNSGTIPYNQYNYGELVAKVVVEGIHLCNEIKLHKQIQKEKTYGKRILGDFYEQLCLSPINPTNEERRFRKPHKRKFYKNKKFRKENYAESSKIPKRKSQWPYKRKEQNKPTKRKFPIYWKCKTPGHYANKCKLKNKINILEIDEELKNSFTKLFISSSNSEEENLKLSIITEIDSETENEYDLDNDSESDSCDGNCDYYKALCKANGLLMLTKEENFIMDIIDKISDPEEKKNMLKKYLESHKGEKKLKLKEPETYSLKDILNRVKTSNNINPLSTETTIAELQHEVKMLKQEIKELKERMSLIEINPKNDNQNNNNILGVEELNSLTFINVVDKVITHKWHTKVTIVVQKEYYFTTIARFRCILKLH